ncbi:MAG: AAA family ATPase [Anaerolineales bacterium]|nr:AAA family ATPase [Anaerolineales bacterium]
MKSLYITSVEKYSGKTALCLALGKLYQERGLNVGYLKPFSLRPWRIGDKIADEDAAFVIDILGMNAKPWEMSPVVVTAEILHDYLTGKEKVDFMPRVLEAVKFLEGRKDLLLLEGGGSLREGYVMNLSTPDVAKELGSEILVVVKYCEDACLLDDVLTAKFRLPNSLSGVVINRVPEHAMDFVNNIAVPFLEKEGVPILGVLPNDRELAALSVGEIIEVLDAEVLTSCRNEESLVEALMVGAMTEDSAIRRFRKQQNKAVITGGDRTDIQLAAMETSTTCLILTGNLTPNNLIIKQAENMSVPILLVPGNTMETVEALDRIFGKTRLRQKEKLDKFIGYVKENFDLNRLDKALEGK